MGNNSKYIIAFLLLIGNLSCIYFLSILYGLPFFVAIVAISISTFFLLKWFFKNEKTIAINKRLSWLVIIIFILCLFTLSKNMYFNTLKHGQWDAWGIWNLHVRYLLDPIYWKNIFLNLDTDHADYPLCHSSFLALVIRLFGNQFQLFLTCIFFYLITFSIPFLIFSEISRKNIVVALFTFFLFAQDSFFANQGVSQLADSLLSLFFLTAIISINYVALNKKYIAICAAMLACCLWTKNEGTILAAIFFLFYAPTFFSLTNIKYTFSGAALPLFTFIMFKYNCPVQNDMLSTSLKEKFLLTFRKDRYILTLHYFKQYLNQCFYYTKIGLYIYTILLCIRKRLPSKQMILILTCLVVYMSIYIYTPRDLHWHLITSQYRLMLHLMPSIIYVISLELSDINFTLLKNKLGSDLV